MSAGGPGSSTVKKRLSSTVWIGNLGSSLTEYQVLKFAQQVGNVEKFDFMYHETTTSTGQDQGKFRLGSTQKVKKTAHNLNEQRCQLG